MGSIAAAPKLNGQPEGEKQLPISPTPEATATRPTSQANVNPNSTAANQVDRVEQLLAQLEAKSVALVPYGYWNQAQTQENRSSNWIIVTVLGCLWLLSLALVFAYSTYRHSPRVTERNVSTTPLVISPPFDQQDQKTVPSANNLTKALRESSKRLNHIEAALQKSNQDLQQLRTKVGSEVKSRATTLQPETLPVDSNQAATISAITRGKTKQNATLPSDANQTDAFASRPTPDMPNTPTAPVTTSQGLLVRPTDTAVPHRAADGTIEFWLVTRGASPKLHRVQPIAITKGGIVIYCLEDGKKYTLTRQGDWRKR